MSCLKVFSICLLLIIFSTSKAVKIGVARTSYNNTSNTTPVAPITVTPIVTEITTQATTKEESIEATLASTTTIMTTTTQRSLPTFPPKKVQTALKRATPKPTTTSTTTLMPTPSANNISVDQLNNATLIGVNHDDELSSYNYCSCDLHNSFCDINCCCDRDCTEAMLKVFTCHTVMSEKALQTRLDDFQYAHGLPSCKVNDGWLCVFRTNIKPPQKKCPMLNFDTSNYYKWPEILNFDDTDTEHEDMYYYKYGEPLRLLNMETMTVQNFELPTSFKPPYCQIMTPIRHLITLNSNCLVESPEQLQESIYNLINLTNNAKVLKAPSYSNIDLNKDAQNLASIQVCRKTKTDVALQCHNNIDSYNMTESIDSSFEYATKIVFQVLHNYTNIQAVIVVLYTETIADDTTELWQHFSLEYVYQNFTTIEKLADIQPDQQKPISGPLGYIQGAPIIISQLKPAHNDETTHILDYFNPNVSASAEHYTLPLFSKRQGVCHKNRDITYAINYGVNVAKECNLRFNSDELHMENRLTANYTDYCQRLQAAIMLQLLPAELLSLEELSKLVVSPLGKPKAALDKWLSLELKNYEYATISGDFNQQTQTYTCRNIILGASYEFHIGVYTLNDLRHQRVIKHAAYVVGQLHDLEFELTEVVELPLTMTVMFYDIKFGRRYSVGASIHYFSVAYIFHAALIFIVYNNCLS